MVIVILRDDGRADNWSAFEQDVSGILREHAPLIHGIWPAVRGWAPEVKTTCMCVELPDDQEVIAEIRKRLTECRAGHRAEQLAWFVPEVIDTL